MSSFYSNGKLLLTGEYTVLDGALSLAIPTSFGQSLKVSPAESPSLFWKSLDEKGSVWFEGVFDLRSDLPDPEKLGSSFLSEDHIRVAKTLVKILKEAQKLNPNFLSDGKGYVVETRLGFPRDWGLGSSSTLINNIAQWAEVDPFELLWNSFSGSGYDIACAQNDHPILYHLEHEKPIISKVDFDPSFKDQLFFIHLNKKQDSRAGIAQYRKLDFDKHGLVYAISEITKALVSCQDLPSFEVLLTRHEALLSRTLKIPTVKDNLFSDFKGAIKSLGAWGGDFILATGDEETPAYFKNKGFHTVVPYVEMLL